MNLRVLELMRGHLFTRCVFLIEHHELVIFVRLFIQFGLMKNLIVRLQKYPVLLSDEPSVDALKQYRE